MADEWKPTQKQLTTCFRILRKNIKSNENKKDIQDRIIEKRKHWDYGTNPQKKNVALGPKTILPRIDSVTLQKELLHITTHYDADHDIHKVASYLLTVLNNISFWLLKGVQNNGDKIFFDDDDGDYILHQQQLLIEFNLSKQIGQCCWDIIDETLYGRTLCVYYGAIRLYSIWRKVINRDALVVAFDVTREYRMSYCPAILIGKSGVDLMILLSGSDTIDNKKHVGFGLSNIIQKKRKTAGEISGNLMCHIIRANKRDVCLGIYMTNNANVDVNDIRITLEPRSFKKNNDDNIEPIIIFPKQDSIEVNNNLIMDNNDNNNNNNNNVINVHGNNPNIIADETEQKSIAMNHNNHNDEMDNIVPFSGSNSSQTSNMNDGQFVGAQLPVNNEYFHPSDLYPSNIDPFDITRSHFDDAQYPVYDAYHTVPHFARNVRYNPLGSKKKKKYRHQQIHFKYYIKSEYNGNYLYI